MARIMRTTGEVFIANGAIATLLTVPALKKYELLMTIGHATSTGGGINYAEVSNDGAGTAFLFIPTFPAGLFVVEHIFGPLCLLAGTTFAVAFNNTTAGGTVQCTFMDVDT